MVPVAGPLQRPTAASAGHRAGMQMTHEQWIEWLLDDGARMAADKLVHDESADQLLAEALGDTEWLLEINDGEVESP